MFHDARFAKLKSVAQHRDLARLFAQPFHVLLRFFTETFEHHSAEIFRAKNFRALGFDPAGANADLIDAIHQLRDEMKLKAGVAKGRDLPFRRENNLRILNGVFDVVLFQNSAGEDTTKQAQVPVGWSSRDPSFTCCSLHTGIIDAGYNVGCQRGVAGIGHPGERETARSASALLFLQERQERFVAFVFHSFYRNEMEGSRVDGIALSARRRRVGKEMAEVGIAAFGADLDALHVPRIVRFFNDEIFRDRFGKRGPAGAAIEFVERSEEWFAGGDIDVDAGAFVFPELILEGGFCTILAHDKILVRL